jgi:hypothetical protein
VGFGEDVELAIEIAVATYDYLMAVAGSVDFYDIGYFYSVIFDIHCIILIIIIFDTIRMIGLCFPEAETIASRGDLYGLIEWRLYQGLSWL